jgi:glycosyltransferase involved in cell wall biosynthesis
MSQTEKKIAIFIPAFNAASTVVKVLDRIPAKLKHQVGEIFVIDNHSTDNTSMVVVGYKEQHNMHNLEVIRNPQNMGYGGSQKIAYKRCIDKGYDCVAMLHGDAQYAPELLETLIAPVVNGEADMVFGSRMSGNPLKGGMPIIRFLGNRALTTMQNFFLGTSLTEFHSGYRVFSVDALKKLPLEKFSSDYHFDTEIIILFVDKKLRIKEMPIPTHYGDEKNYVNIWDYGMRVLISTATYFFHKLGLRRSRNWSRILNTGNPATELKKENNG